MSARTAHQPPTTQGSDPRSTFGSLRNRNFRLFVSGQLISNIGGWAQRVAQDWLVLTLTGSATAVGIVVALQLFPTILLGPIGGLIADRFGKRTVLLCTQSLMGTCAALLAVLTLSGSVLPWHIYLLATVLGMAMAVDNPTRQSFVNEMVGPQLLRNAISLNAAVFQIGGLAGPAAAGVLIGLVGIGWAFALNAVTFLAVLGGLTAIRTSELHVAQCAARRHGPGPSAAAEMLARPEMRWPTLLAGVSAFFSISFPVTLAAFANSEFDAGATGFALLTSALAVGSVVGSLLSARATNVRLRGLVAVAAALAAAQLAAAAAPGYAGLALLLLAVGCCSVVFGVSANAGVQMAAADHNRGRIMGLYMLVVIGAGCLGGPVIGLINTHLGPRAAFGIGALVLGTSVVLVGRRLARDAGIDVVPGVRRRVLLGSQWVRVRARGALTR